MTSSIATILFTDVVDSTALLQRLGDERARAVFGRTDDWTIGERRVTREQCLRLTLVVCFLR